MSGNAYHSFDHPWFQTLIMFCGETLCLIGLIYHRRKARMAAQEEVSYSLSQKFDSSI